MADRTDEKSAQHVFEVVDNEKLIWGLEVFE